MTTSSEEFKEALQKALEDHLTIEVQTYWDHDWYTDSIRVHVSVNFDGVEIASSSDSVTVDRK